MKRKNKGRSPNPASGFVPLEDIGDIFLTDLIADFFPDDVLEEWGISEKDLLPTKACGGFTANYPNEFSKAEPIFIDNLSREDIAHQSPSEKWCDVRSVLSPSDKEWLMQNGVPF